MSKFFKYKSSTIVCLSLLLALFSPYVIAQNCQLDNGALRAMPDTELTMINSSDETLLFIVRAALNNQTRAAGFQRVCASTIAEKPILFVFDRPTVPQFHMRNVVAPIDIAFIDEQGQVVNIQAMKPYVVGSTIRPLYSPGVKVVAALEVAPGFFMENKIEVGSVLKWSLAEESQNN